MSASGRRRQIDRGGEDARHECFWFPEESRRTELTNFCVCVGKQFVQISNETSSASTFHAYFVFDVG